MIKPHKDYSGNDWKCLLAKQPQLSKHCDWEKLDGVDWYRLLLQQPQLSEHCRWETLGGYDWYMLLCKQPRFAKHCYWNKLNGTQWAWLLQDQPQIVNTEQLHILAVSKTKNVFDLLIDPSDRVHRVHEMKWVI